MNQTKYIFIVGSSRSGTTMMSRVLNQHPLIHTFKELHFFSQIYSSRKKDHISINKAIEIMSVLLMRQEYGLFQNKNKNKFFKISNSILLHDKDYTYFDVFQKFIEYILLKNNKKIACLHTPNNLFYLQDILSYLSNVRVVNMIRDNRDILLSQKNKWRRKFLGAKRIPFYESLRSKVNYHPLITSYIWNRSIKRTNFFCSNSFFSLLKFEDFLSSPKEKTMQLCAFLEIPFNEDMLKIANIGSSTENDSGRQLIDESKKYKWKKGGLNNSEIYIAQFVSSNFMNQFHYKKQKFIFPPIGVLLYLVSAPFKILASLLLNLGRLTVFFDMIKFHKT